MKKRQLTAYSKQLAALLALALFSGCASFKSSKGYGATIDTTGDGVKGSYADPLGNEMQFDTKPE